MKVEVAGELAGAARRSTSRLIDLFYPARCVGCGRFGTLLCGRCIGGFEQAMGPGRCRNCSARWDGEDFCPRCFHIRSADQLVAAAEMQGAARRAVHALKYERVRAIASAMAEPMRRLRSEEHFDLAFAVPLHPSRQRRRGFNQAEEILRHLGWPHAEGELRRVRKTSTQVGRRERERRTNVADAFEYSGAGLEGARVAIVDDVITTGATMDECAGVLKEAGAARVVGVAFARASYLAGRDEPITD